MRTGKRLNHFHPVVLVSARVSLFMNLCLVSLVKCTNAPMCHYRVCASYCKPRLLRIPSAPGPSQLLGQLATINPRNPNLERCQKESSPFPGSNGRLWIVPQLPGPVCGGWGVGMTHTLLTRPDKNQVLKILQNQQSSADIRAVMVELVWCPGEVSEAVNFASGGRRI